MKKHIYALVLILLLTLSVLASCSTNNNDDGNIPAGNINNNDSNNTNSGNGDTENSTPTQELPEDDGFPDTPVSDFDYKYDSDLQGVVITKYKGEDEKVRIPDTIQGDPVVMIGRVAFIHKKSITDLYMPKTVINIGSEAFLNCDKLSNIVFSGTLECLSYSVFSGAYWYERQPDGLVCFGNALYKYKGEMPPNTVINIPEGVTIIAERAFMGYSKLTSITIPDSVTSISYEAFSDCEGLTTVTIGNGVKTIGSSAFSGCTGLTSVTIPDNVKKIHENAFRGCTSLDEATSQRILSITPDANLY